MKHTKKYLPFLLFLLIVVLFPVSANAKSAKTKLNKTKLTLTVGESATLQLKNNSKKVKWSSSNEKVAKVSSKGKVTAKKVGRATVTAKAAGKVYRCSITVKAKTSKIQLDKTSVVLKKRDATVKLKAKINPSGAKLIWQSSDQNVAIVNANGKVTAITSGTATITVYAKNNPKVKASCNVTVEMKKQPISKLTPDLVYERLTELMDIYPPGFYWPNCGEYAYAIGNYLFGDFIDISKIKPKSIRGEQFETLLPGDMIHAVLPSGAEHWFVIISPLMDDVYHVLDPDSGTVEVNGVDNPPGYLITQGNGNFLNEGVYGVVTWGDPLALNELTDIVTILKGKIYLYSVWE